MSKGLGMMQRRILRALSARPGGDDVDYVNGSGFTLAEGVHDLRRICRKMDDENSRRTVAHWAAVDYVGSSWQNSFSRAVAGLVARGYLDFPQVVRVTNAKDMGSRIMWLADGNPYIGQPNRRRFVSVMKDFTTLKSAAP
jgi:hypothetical protein